VTRWSGQRDENYSMSRTRESFPSNLTAGTSTTNRLAVRRVGLAVVPMILVTLVASGCAAARPAADGPPPSATSLPTPTQTLEPEVTALVLRATSMDAVDADGRIVDSVPFSASGDEAIAFLEGIADAAPALSTSAPDDHCSSGQSVAAWGDGFTLGYDFGRPAPTGMQMVVDVTEPALPNGVLVQTPSGLGVGDLGSDLEAAQPGVYTFRMGDGPVYASVHYDVGAGTPAALSDYDAALGDYWGASAQTTDGVITQLSSPRTYIDAC
jgi:hypothetical protein